MRVTPIEHWDMDGIADQATIKAAPGAGKRLVVVGWTITNTVAEATKVWFDTDAAANRFINLLPAAAGGESRSLGSTHAVYCTENTAIKVTAATGAVRGTLYGYVQSVA